jgi:hypothetical protein
VLGDREPTAPGSAAAQATRSRCCRGSSAPRRSSGLSLLSGFDLINDDPAHGELIVYVHKHLFRRLEDRAGIRSPAFCYPQPDVLGYTDALMLDLLPYAGLRLTGDDPFLRMQLLAIALSALCLFCTFSPSPEAARILLLMQGNSAICGAAGRALQRN